MEKGGVRKIQRKTKLFITSLILTLAIAIVLVIPLFWINPVSSLGKYIHAQFVCEQSRLPIVGLDITIGLETHITDQEGKVVFGSGYASGTYTIEWEWWDGSYSIDITIDCSKKDWCLEPYPYPLKNPEVHKTFLVDTHTPVPAEGLDVELVGYGIKTTDAKGYAMWVVDYPFTATTLEWTWNSASDSEPVAWIDFIEGIWSKTNYLEPKSDGDKTTLG